jgi:Na+/melibiose symporter-like transporter
VAGLLLLLGQVADAISTPLIGYGSDKNLSHFVCKYGRRKIWHLIGTICVSCSFPFIFNSCFVCDESGFWIKFLYYSSFIVVFQFGWAAVQVSHVSLITDLTTVSSQRVELNAYRYRFSILTMFIF